MLITIDSVTFTVPCVTITVGDSIYKVDETLLHELQIEKLVSPEDVDETDMCITPINLNQIIIY